MKLRSLALGAVAAASMFAIPAVANAAWGTATGSVNFRTCASTGCPSMGVVPGGAQVWINGSQGSWYNVTFQGRQGFVSGNYVATGYAQGPQYGGPQYGGPQFVAPRYPRYAGNWRGQPPRSGYYRNPWWDNRHNAWYDGRRWYRNGIWFNDPSGFSFGFSFN
jgi:uncharacterized protein YraI